MGHTLLCVLVLLMNTFRKYGVAQESTAQNVTATLRGDKRTVPMRGSVMLTCSVDTDDSSRWRYRWFRRTTGPVVEIFMRNRNISVTEGGIYWCRGEKSDLKILTENSNMLTIHKIVSSRAVVTLKPNCTQIFSGETITLSCEIQGGGGTKWTYEWMKSASNTSVSHNEYKIRKALKSDSGNYWCKGRHSGNLYSSTEWSDAITLTVSQKKPKANINAERRVIPIGGSVTLTCTERLSPAWKYYWYRGDKRNPERKQLNAPNAVLQAKGQIRVSQEGLYWCRGGRGDPVYYTEYSEVITLYKLVANRAVVTVQPNWPKIYKEETITLKCDIKDEEDTEWEYEWKTSSSIKPPAQHETLIIAYRSYSGDYRCMGRKKNAQMSMTEWSDAFTLIVYDNKPRPVLTVSPSWLSPGASVTLNCEVEHPSAGWRFYWYKTVPDLSHNSYSYELLPGSSSGTEQDSYIVHGQTHTAGYVCRAGRGDRVYYTQYSEPKFVWSGDLHPAASLTVNPDRVQHFTSDSVSLSCEGNSAEWRVKRFTDKDLLDCSEWGTITGSTCNIHRLQEGDAVYWCESQSGEFSNAVNITGQTKDIILVSPVHPVTKGDPVTLGCKLTTTELDSNVFFYHNDKLIQNDTRQELNISAVSKSDEGFYKCECSGKESRQSWVAVKSLESSFPVPVLGGLLSGIVMIILLFLLCHYKKAKGSYCDRPIQSLSTNQDFAMDQTASETQQPVYSSLLHGDVSVYESIRGSKNTTDGTTGAFPSHHLTGLDKSDELGGHDDPEESSDYYNMREELANGP